jgi:hypothetical protein
LRCLGGGVAERGAVRVGNDEDNTLQTYRRGHPGPISSLRLSDFLGAGLHETDIESALPLDLRICWMDAASAASNWSGAPI